jgi:hypothetical protein
MAYNASKGAVRLMTKSAAVQFARKGIRVNSGHPGVLPAMTTSKATADPAFRKKMLAGVPMRRAGRVEEVAHAVLFLASDEASYITGTELVVDGGWLAVWAEQRRTCSASGGAAPVLGTHQAQALTQHADQGRLGLDRACPGGAVHAEPVFREQLIPIRQSRRLAARCVRSRPWGPRRGGAHGRPADDRAVGLEIEVSCPREFRRPCLATRARARA